MSIPESILREIERAIQAAELPRGMSVHDGKAKVDSSHLRRLLAELAALRAELESAHAAQRHAETELSQYMAWYAMAEHQHLHEQRRAERAEQEAAKLRADAGRWRTVSAMMTHEHRGDAVGWTLSVILPGDDPDAAIDATLTQEDHND